MSDIRRWLESIGLNKYAEAFEQNDLELDVLSEITDDELKELGVSLGHRKKLSKAIAELLDSQAIDQGQRDSARVTSQTKSQVNWSRVPEDRRPVTLLFADITGSTTLTEHLDPEDAHTVLYGALQSMGRAVERHRGTVCRLMGDGLMAIFGVPVTFESQAIEACRAALEMQQAVAEYANELGHEHGDVLRLRIGLHAGEVVALQVDKGGWTEWDASGPAVALAARMEQSAAPGTIQLTKTTFDSVSDQMRGATLTPVTVKGFADPIEVVQLVEAKSTSLTPVGSDIDHLVGRRAELGQLLAALDCCERDRYSQCVFLRGEPGIGKTRLVEELAREALSRGFSLHQTVVLDYGVRQRQAPIPVLVRSFLGLPLNADVVDRKAALKRAVADGLVSTDEQVFLHDALDLPLPDSLSAQLTAMTTGRRKEAYYTLFSSLLDKLSALQPVMLIIENLHWADETTLDFIGYTVRHLGDKPVLMTMTTRSAGDPLQTNWGTTFAHVPLCVITLGPLRTAELSLLAQSVPGVEESEIPARVERSEGNPLFLLHLLRSKDRQGTDLPTSLQTLVTSSIALLGTKDLEAIHAAAVLGHWFSLESLRAVLGDLKYDCRPLVEAHLIRYDGDDCLFSHGLIMDAVLGSLLRPHRRRLHKSAAAWFQERDMALYALHLEEAGEPSASEAYEAAARAEAARFRFDHSISLIDRAIVLNEGTGRASRLAQLNGEYLLGVGATQRAAEAFSSAAAQAIDPEAGCQAQIGLAHALRDLGEYGRGIEVLNSAQRDAENAGLTRQLSEIYHHRGNIRQLQVDPDGCREANENALKYARESGSPALEALALGGLARAFVISGRFKSQQRYATQCIDVCRTSGLEQLEYTFRHFLAFASFYSADLDAACAQYKNCVDRGPAVGAIRPMVIANLGFGEALLELGKPDDAGQLLDESERVANLIGEPRYFSCIQALRGRIAWSRGESRAALAIVESALSEIGAADERWGKLYLLGALARLTNNASTRRATLEEGIRICSGPCWGIGAVRFLWDAMNSTLAAEEWDFALSHADALARFSHEEPMELFELLIARTRAIANYARGERTELAMKNMRGLKESIETIGLSSDAAFFEGITTVTSA